MKDIIEAIKNDLAALDYLQWVEPIDNEFNPPFDRRFPGVGIKDGDIVYESRPNRRDYATVKVLLFVYVDFLSGESGAAIMGSVEQGERFRGLIEIADEIRARLADNFLGIVESPIVFAHVDQIGASQTLGNEDQPLLQMKRMDITYRRFV